MSARDPWGDPEPVEAEVKTEADRVFAWRLHNLLKAGYPIPLAEQLAGSSTDLHEAVELLARGCPAELAAEILREL